MIDQILEDQVLVENPKPSNPRYIFDQRFWSVYNDKFLNMKFLMGDGGDISIMFELKPECLKETNEDHAITQDGYVLTYDEGLKTYVLVMEFIFIPSDMTWLNNFGHHLVMTLEVLEQAGTEIGLASPNGILIKKMYNGLYFVKTSLLGYVLVYSPDNFSLNQLILKHTIGCEEHKERLQEFFKRSTMFKSVYKSETIVVYHDPKTGNRVLHNTDLEKYYYATDKNAAIYDCPIDLEQLTLEIGFLLAHPIDQTEIL